MGNFVLRQKLLTAMTPAQRYRAAKRLDSAPEREVTATVVENLLYSHEDVQFLIAAVRRKKALDMEMEALQARAHAEGRKF